MNRLILPFLACALALNLAIPAATAATPATATTPAATATSRPGISPTATMVFRFENATVDDILTEMARRFSFIILSNQVTARLTIQVPDPVTADEAVRMLNNLLVPLGYAALEIATGEGADAKTILRVDSIAVIRKLSIPVFVGANPDNIPMNDTIITQVIPLKNVVAAALRDDLLPLVGQGPDITVSGNCLIVTDTSAKIHRLAEIIAKLDVPPKPGTITEFWQLQNANAADVARAINVRYSPAARAGPATTPASHVYANSDPRTNTVVLNGPSEQVKEELAIVKQLDDDAAPPPAINTGRTGP